MGDRKGNGDDEKREDKTKVEIKWTR
jgi:hypothetical protein